MAPKELDTTQVCGSRKVPDAQGRGGGEKASSQNDLLGLSG